MSSCCILIYQTRKEVLSTPTIELWLGRYEANFFPEAYQKIKNIVGRSLNKDKRSLYFTNFSVIYSVTKNMLFRVLYFTNCPVIYSVMCNMLSPLRYFTNLSVIQNRFVKYAFPSIVFHNHFNNRLLQQIIQIQAQNYIFYLNLFTIACASLKL